MFAIKVINANITILICKFVFFSCKEFSALLTDDLGMALLALSSARYIMYPNTILQQVLNVFSSLLNSAAAPNLRILIECFIRQVYIKALMQAYDMFSTQVSR